MDSVPLPVSSPTVLPLWRLHRVPHHDPTHAPTAPPAHPPTACSAHLSDSANDLHELEELWVAGCAQVTALRLRSHRLGRLVLSGTRALQELELRCALLEEVDIRPLNPGLAASLALK